MCWTEVILGPRIWCSVFDTMYPLRLRNNYYCRINCPGLPDYEKSCVESVVLCARSKFSNIITISKQTNTQSSTTLSIIIARPLSEKLGRRYQICIYQKWFLDILFSTWIFFVTKGHWSYWNIRVKFRQFMEFSWDFFQNFSIHSKSCKYNLTE